MRAAVYHGRGDIRVEQVPEPVPAADEILLEVHAVGVCGTDAAEWRDGPSIYAVPGPDPNTGHSGPLIPGHELSGRVVAVGRPDLEPLPFFTNSIGRFGLLGLRPSLHYRVEIYQDNKVVPAFEFTVPKDTKGLLELKAVPMQKSN